MPKPRYQVRCARRCLDNRGRPRPGDQWVHIHGQTYWVCGPCAEWLGRSAGIPTAQQRRAAARREERRSQLPMDAQLLEAQAAEGLEDV